MSVEGENYIGDSEPDLLDASETEYGNVQEQQSQEENNGYATEHGTEIEDTDGNTATIAAWKEKRQAEIEEKDASDEQERKELKEEAVKHIDDFYDNYNRKKEQQLETVRREAEEFLKKKDNFFSQDNTTTWDRALQLINEDDADILGGRDRSKFKEILQRMKGNTNAPGA
ncbi:hypothetical protein HG535_0G03360 [Zygotorulaspora mrakii]|uniref:Clathrin light chain n=1 Tax=Zygotorulaspora mrakii TaxID=42260 RepID=A0A7H9B7H0_ZYGMR|nr:uncharacterized protein HG535_0G03360 [Zygotorulaspora mrakii]QLG74453.1 hypothetical protein HG535_0G03360 [Zygotorulaspora mrakii]